MIAAMLLMAQLSSQTPGAQAASPSAVEASPRGEVATLLAPRRRPAPCVGNLGQMEVSLIEPTALYRKGDRPAKGLREWAAYPTPALCLVGGAP